VQFAGGFFMPGANATPLAPGIARGTPLYDTIGSQIAKGCPVDK
jgi:hypothetical protein